MDDSIVLLSTMSPKITTKYYYKGTSILALKKNIRRSSICDKSIRTAPNEKVCMVEGSTSTGSVNTKYSNSLKKMNETVIVVSDTSSTSTNSEKESMKTKTLEQDNRTTNNCLLTKEKIKEISQWINGISSDKVHETVYSELSTIYGEEGDIFQPKDKGSAINSTLLHSPGKRFDECFKKSDQGFPFCLDTKELAEKSVIEDSFEEHGKYEIDASSKDVLSNSFKSYEKNSYSQKSTEGNSEKGTPQTPKYINEDMESEIGSVLDSIYGKKWREKQDQIIPKSEPRQNRLKPVNVTHSERKPTTLMTYRNPYLDSEKSTSQEVLKNLHRSKIKKNLESSFVKKIYDICDSDTQSDSSPFVLKKTKAKVIFDDSFDKELNIKSAEDRNDDIIDQKSDDEKENFNISDLGISLENKIRRKILNVPDVPGNFKIKKNSGKEKENKKVRLKKKISPLKAFRFNDPPTHKTDQSTSKHIPKTEDNITNRRETKTSSSSSVENVSSDDDDEWNRRISTIHYKKPTSGTYSFLASLSGSVPISKCDMSARIFRNNFKSVKNNLLIKLFDIYNEKVFDNSIPKDTSLEWNDRMRGTAGFCYSRKVTHKNGTIVRSVRIVLSNKVIDSADRLRDTLVHEMCHAATWIVNGVSDGHGKFWKSWAFKAMQTFPELPPIKRCHDYSIKTKYTYRCTGCGYSIGRHSKSLDIERKRCGHCLNKFEVLLNKVSKKGEVKSVPATPKKGPQGFALFVKENYGTVKTSHIKHGEVMKILGQKFQEMKLNNININGIMKPSN